MKKIIIALATISVFIFAGCFADSDTATVRISLGNLPVTKTTKVEKKSLIDNFLMIFAKEAVAQEVPGWVYVNVVHLGAFDENNKRIAKKSIEVTEAEGGQSDVHTVVEFDVPARNGVRIVVLGEQETYGDDDKLINVAGYYGSSDPINLTADNTEEVEISMKILSTLLYKGNLDNIINLRYDENHPNHNLEGGIAVIKWDRIYGVSNYIINYGLPGYDYEEIYKGSSEKFTHIHQDVNDVRNYQIKLEFNFAKINSESTDYNLYD